MITGTHAIIFSKRVEEMRRFFGRVLGLRSVDAGGGWLIFALPPAELAMHPARKTTHELYLMCDDIRASVNRLKAKGVAFTERVSDRGWGLLTRMRLPDGSTMGLYEPRHSRPDGRARRQTKKGRA